MRNIIKYFIIFNISSIVLLNRLITVLAQSIYCWDQIQPILIWSLCPLYLSLISTSCILFRAFYGYSDSLYAPFSIHVVHLISYSLIKSDSFFTVIIILLCVFFLFSMDYKSLKVRSNVFYFFIFHKIQKAIGTQ